VAWADGQRTSFGTLWQDLIDESGGEVLARYDAGPWAGYPAVLSKQAGAGRTVYVGTRLDNATLGALLEQVLAERRSGDEARPVAGVERVVRRAAGASYEFLINHRDEPASVPLAAAGQDLLSGAAVSGRLELPPQGVAIVRRES
jgi:beta-galactosidase